MSERIWISRVLFPCPAGRLANPWADTVKIQVKSHLIAIEKEVKMAEDQSDAAWTLNGTVPGDRSCV